MIGSDGKKASPDKLQSLQASVTLTDKWARVYLARLCSAILYAEWASTQEFAKGQGKPFWTLLLLLVTRCRVTTPHLSLRQQLDSHPHDNRCRLQGHAHASQMLGTPLKRLPSPCILPP